MNHLIQVVDCLNEDELKRCLELLELKQDYYIGATVYREGEDEKFKVDTSSRSNTICPLEDNDEMSRILSNGMIKGLNHYKRRLLKVNSTYDQWPMPGVMNTKLTRDKLQLLRYEPGQQYHWHTDQLADRNHSLYHRLISVVLYLNNDFEGGMTCFPIGCFKPEPGQAVMFPSNWGFPHRAEEVISGTKHACVSWYMCEYYPCD